MNSILPKLKALIFYGSLFTSTFLAFSHQTKLLGQASLVLLTIVIFTKPAVKLFPTIGFFKILLAHRRQLGQATAFFALAHASIQIKSYIFSFDLSDFRFWGLLAILLMIPLLITSNDFSTRLLKRNWFLLQKLIHPLYIVAMIHYGLREGLFGLIKSAFILSVLYFSRLLASHGVKFPVL